MRAAAILLFLFCWLCVVPTHSASGQDAPQADPVPANRFRHWTTNWSFQVIDLNDLVRRISAWGIPIPVELAGQASVDFDVSIPLNAPWRPEAYKFRGTLAATNLVVDDLTFRTFSADVLYENGVLTLDKMRGTKDVGSFSGRANATLIPRGDFAASLNVEEVDFGPIAKLLQKFEVIPVDRPIRGIVSLQVEAAGKVEQLRSPETWKVTGNANVTEFSVGDSLRYALSVDRFQLQDSQLSLPELRLTAAELPNFYLEGSADLPLDSKRPFRFDLQSNDLPATDLVGLYFDSPQRIVDGKFDFRARGQGSFPANGAAADFEVDVQIASPSLYLAGVDMGVIEHRIVVTPERFRMEPLSGDAEIEQADLRIRRVSADYQVSDQAIELSGLEAEIFDGTLRAVASLVRRGNADHTLKAEWSEISPRYRIRMPLLDEPVQLVAQSSGSIDWMVPAGKVELPSMHRGTANFRLDSIRLGEDDVGTVDVDLLVADKAIDVTASGVLFDGNVTIKAATPLAVTTQWRDVPVMLLPAAISMSDVSLSRLLSLTTKGTTRFEGKLAGDVELTRSRESGLQSEANLELRTLTAGNRLLASLLSLQLTTSGTEINVVSARGRYANGQLQAQGRWSLGSGPRLISFRLTRGRGDRVLLPISQRAETWFGGLVSGRGTIVGQASEPGTVRASGSLEVERGVAFGFPVGDAHSSFNSQFSADPVRWNVSFPAVSASLARGRVKGSLEFSSTSSRRSGFHMQSHWRAQHVDFENLLSAYVGTSTIGRGDVTGEFQLGGRNISGLRDLQGRYRVRLGGTDASAVPGLSAAGSLLGASSLAGVRFTSGESHGRIHRGDLLIESMKLSSEQATVTATGRVGLESRRMDVLAVLSTGNFEGQNDLLAASVSQIVLDQVPLIQINRLVSDRTLVVKFVGPTRDPIIQLLPAETIQVNARRFASQQLLGLVIADSIWNNWSD